MDSVNIKNFLSNQSDKVKQRIRDKAVTNANKTLRRQGKLLSEISPEIYEGMVAEEEEAVIKNYMKLGGAGMIFFGFMPWF